MNDRNVAHGGINQRFLKLVEGKSVMLEEYAREMIYAEETHIGEVDKMLREPGEVGVFHKLGK
jgi:bacterioferritin